MKLTKQRTILISLICILTLAGISYGLFRGERDDTIPQTTPQEEVHGKEGHTHGNERPEGMPVLIDEDVVQKAVPAAKRAAVAYVSYQKSDSESTRKSRIKPLFSYDSPALQAKLPTIIQQGTRSQGEVLYIDWWQVEDGQLVVSVALKIAITGDDVNKTIYQVYTIPMKQDGDSYMPYDISFSDEEVVLKE